MEPTPNTLPDPFPRRQTRLVPLGKPRRPRASGNPASVEGMVACFAIAAGGLGATAAMGGLRLADLVIAGLVMLGLIFLAMRDSRYLPVGIMATWMFVPLVRRIVDWQSGGYTSITALSLLPTMATSALIIPMFRRLRLTPRRLVEPLLLMVLPVLVASGVGVFRYGPSAILEGSGWLLPLLFVPYLATRPASREERFWLLRAMVLLAGLAAAYGLYQFFYLPRWDALWLYESGMMGSMGRPVPMEIRIWGPLNAGGTAAAVWAVAIVSAFADRSWASVRRYPVIGLMVMAICLTFGRGSWLMVVAGVVIQIAISGRRGGLSIALSALLVGLTLFLALPFLPKGEKVVDRMFTLSDLDNDGSYNSRKMTTQAMFHRVLDQPLGVGMGWVTASKIEGQTNLIAAVDSGYAELALTLGWVGAAAYICGMVRLFLRCLSAFGDRRDPDSAWGTDLRSLACACLVIIGLATFAGFSMTGIMAAWVCCCVGLAVAPPVGHPATTSQSYRVNWSRRVEQPRPQQFAKRPVQ